MSDEQEYDVAISFLAEDETLAVQIRDALDPPLNVFVYSRKQRKLAGRDGVEAFREVFGGHARLALVLYRGGWGQTSWTRVEETAIKEVCLEHGWERMFLVRLERESSVPKWVPKPHLYLDLNAFGFADLIGAIKARLIELDVELAPISPTDRASAQAKQRKFDEETEQLLAQSNNPFLGALEHVKGKLTELGNKVSEQTGWDVAVGEGALIGGFIISAEGQTVQLTMREVYANTARNAYVEVNEYDTGIPVNDPNLAYHAFEPIRAVGSNRLELRRLPDVGWCWELNDRVLTPEATAEAIMHILLDRLS